MSSSPYPNAYQIEEKFNNRANTDLFNSYLADDVDVLVVGGDDFHLGGRYSGVNHWHDSIFNYVMSAVKVEIYKVEVIRVIGGGQSPWAAVETLSTATSKYDKPYTNLHVDLVRFNSQGKMAHLREFFDTRHIHEHLEEHHQKSGKGK